MTLAYPTRKFSSVTKHQNLLPLSQESVTVPCSEPDEPSPHHDILRIWDSFQRHPAILAYRS
jgi:hypothetical protein